jgi:hypothetical protein
MDQTETWRFGEPPLPEKGSAASPPRRSFLNYKIQLSAGSGRFDIDDRFGQFREEFVGLTLFVERFLQ